MRKQLPVLFIIIAFYSFTYAQPDKIFDEYIQALILKQWDKAKSYWLPSEMEASKRLGISFNNIEAKYDCASPLLSALDGIRRGSIGVDVVEDSTDNNTARLMVKIYSENDSLITPYYLVKKDIKWYLCSRLHFYTRDWTSIQTRYTNVYFSDSSKINDYALSELDRSIDKLGNRLEIKRERMKDLERNKINYYLCDDHQIEMITGYKIQGMTNLQLDAIVTGHLPHNHELTHLMINYALEKLPLYTLPVLQEGIACNLGGRWGKAPSVIFYWGNVSLEFGLAELENILTHDGFTHGTGSLDASYAVSSLFVKSLIDYFGMEKFRLLYLELSGSNDFIRSLTETDIISKTENTFDISWEDINKRFAVIAQNYRYSGIIPCKVPSGKPEYNLSSESFIANTWNLDTLYIFQIRFMKQSSGGLILLDENRSANHYNYTSRVFADHLPDVNYNNQIYGIQFSASEVGLYNYLTDILLAKYVSSFTPDINYWNPDYSTITFSLRKSLLDKDISDYQLQLIK